MQCLVNIISFSQDYDLDATYVACVKMGWELQFKVDYKGQTFEVNGNFIRSQGFRPKFAERKLTKKYFFFHKNTN